MTTQPFDGDFPIEPISHAQKENDSDTPGFTDNSFLTVFSSNADSDSVFAGDDVDLVRLRKECPQFRVLIIGKANAGKTTILQKMCNTTEKPIIRDQKGNIIVDVNQSINQPTDGRGIHDINHELTFSSNPDFVFHDSPGFEAGSVTELEGVRAFTTQRAASKHLKDQLHAIWYCLPLDNDRPLCDAEMGFFEQGTGKTPVIAIFTKYDGLILREYNRMRFEEQCTRLQAREKAPGNADKLFQESEFYFKRLQGVPYPPTRSIRVQDMQKPETNCAELSRQTLEALSSKRLQLLFVSVQQNNLRLSTEFAMKEYMLKALQTLATMKDTAKNIVACYRHIIYDEDYSFQRQFRSHGYEQYLGRYYEQELAKVLDAATLSLAGQGSPSFQALRVGTALLIAAEDSFWLKTTQISGFDAFKLALANYQSSQKHPTVMESLHETFEDDTIQRLAMGKDKTLITTLLEIIWKFGSSI